MYRHTTDNSEQTKKKEKKDLKMIFIKSNCFHYVIATLTSIFFLFSFLPSLLGPVLVSAQQLFPLRTQFAS
jgi:hypothetical protein